MSKLTLRERALMSGSGVCVISVPMLKGFLFSIAVIGLCVPAGAQAGNVCPSGEAEAACMFDTIWAAAEVLPEQTRARVEPDFLYAVDLTEGPGLSKQWRTKLDNWIVEAMPDESFAMRKANKLIDAEGWDAFLQRAEAHASPFNIGRPEIMAAGAQRALQAGDTETAARIINMMTRLGGQISGKTDYERGDFGHAIAELAMTSCDLEMFDTGVAMTAVPGNLRYDLWRTRMTGAAGALAPRILQDADTDSRHVRQAIEGYTPILALGYCDIAQTGDAEPMTINTAAPSVPRRIDVIDKTPAADIN